VEVSAVILLRVFALVLCGLGLAALPARAQIVRGAVVDSASGRPVPGSTVQVTDSSGSRVGTVLTDAEGRFAFRVPRAGRYTLRVQRIGYRTSASTPFDVAVGETVERQLAASAIPVQLAAVRVSAASACGVETVQESDAFVLWEEARKALEATALTRESGRVHMRIVEWERTLDPKSLSVVTQTRTEREGIGKRPYVSPPAETLATTGYVRTASDGESFYHAPDEEALLSDRFLETHCFRVLRVNLPALKGLVGFAFEPIKGRRVPDVRGVLWLDEQTAELRHLEYRFTGLPERLEHPEVGGRVEFQRLPTGAWIIGRWLVRAPVVQTSRRRVPKSYGPGIEMEMVLDSTVVGIREGGGQVTEMSLVDASSRWVTDSGSKAAADSVRAPRADSASTLAPDSTSFWTTAPPDWRQRFEIRRASGRGVFLAGDAFRERVEGGRVRRAPRLVTDVLIDVPGLHVSRARAPRNDFVVTTERTHRGRHPGAALCTVTFYVDGARLSGTPGQISINTMVTPAQIEALEFYEERYQPPPEMPGDGCGVIAIWTTNADQGRQPR
jgi:hypothetical protein